MSIRLTLLALDVPESSIRLFRQLLSEDERQRADRFRTSALAASFISARAALRIVLSRRLGCDPGEIEFLYGLRGKPEVGQPAAARGLPFNLSHSGGYVAVVIGDEQPVGVDLEVLRSLQKSESLARLVFSPQELAWWSELTNKQQTSALFRVWTLKEACLKATGEGFSRPMPSFAVASDSGRLAEASTTEVELASGIFLAVKQVEAPPGYAVAVAMQCAEGPLEVEVQRGRLSEFVEGRRGQC